MECRVKIRIAKLRKSKCRREFWSDDYMLGVNEVCCDASEVVLAEQPTEIAFR